MLEKEVQVLREASGSHRRGTKHSVSHDEMLKDIEEDIQWAGYILKERFMGGHRQESPRMRKHGWMAI